MVKSPSADDAAEAAALGKKVVLVRGNCQKTSQVWRCSGHPTARGGMTSHAAVVARGMGAALLVAVLPAMSLRRKWLNGKEYREGDVISSMVLTSKFMIAIKTVYPSYR